MFGFNSTLGVTCLEGTFFVCGLKGKLKGTLLRHFAGRNPTTAISSVDFDTMERPSWRLALGFLGHEAPWILLVTLTHLEIRSQ